MAVVVVNDDICKMNLYLRISRSKTEAERNSLKLSRTCHEPQAHLMELISATSHLQHILELSHGAHYFIAPNQQEH